MSSAKDYKKVANKKDLKEGGLLKVEPNGTPIVLAMVGGKVYALDAVCTHEGGPLEEGKLEGHNLTCPWHYAVFDVRNGNVSDQTVWATDLQSYAVKVDDLTGDILLSLQTQTIEERRREGAKEGKETKTTPQESKQDKDDEDSDSSQKKYYEEEERKATNKITLELLSKEKLQGTDIITFKFSRGGLNFTAGQYAFFKLDGVDPSDSKGPIRHFSIASSPTEQDYLIISTRIRDTPYKQKLASLQEGQKILAWGPEGDFVLHNDDHSNPVVFLSGGIGVTPFRSMIKYATDKHLRVKITMFDSNKNQENILYKDEFDKWANQNSSIKVVYTLTDEDKEKEEQGQNKKSEKLNRTEEEQGRIDKSMLKRHLTKNDIDNAVFYVCGPPGMLKSMQELLRQQLQVPNKRLKVESFTGY
jgi:ferredoxin-NADP reductase/nitrite reductase/ring-hydroxylating ferredoxin subunit